MLGLSAARALREDGFAVTVHEQHRVGTALGSSSGRSRIYRISYARARLLPAGPARDRGVATARPVAAAWRTACWSTAPASSATPRRWPSAARRSSGWSRHEAERHLPRGAVHRAGAVDARGGRGAGRRRAGRGCARGGGDRGQPRGRSLAAGRGRRGRLSRRLAGRVYDLPVHARIEQVCYFAGAPDGRPSLIHHGGEDGRFWYGLVIARGRLQGGAGRRPQGAVRPAASRPACVAGAGRRAVRLRRRVAPRSRSAAGSVRGLPLHDDAG